jgi:tRNA-specific 2-thiouridylase
MSGRKRIVIGLSGGVDSSVAALRLCAEGWDVHGLFMSNWEEDEEGYCTSAADYQDAREVCERLGIPLHRISFAAEYRERVFRHFLAEYRAGRTPNPDVLCNREIKFGVFVDYARRLGAECVATGHYARLDPSGSSPVLYRARDLSKDQTYFLHAAPDAALRMTRFPLGDLTKAEVRAIAAAEGLPVHAKKDSTGICFIGERPFREFLSGYLPARPGAIVTGSGDVIGEHRGLMYYTLGQRQGLGIGGLAGATDAPWYVAGKDLAANRLIVVQGHDHPALLSDTLTAAQPHWIGGRAPERVFRAAAQTRYRQRAKDCTVTTGGGKVQVSFDEPQRAITPGQFVVFYAGPRCLGGAVIEAAARRQSQVPAAVSA